MSPQAKMWLQILCSKHLCNAISCNASDGVQSSVILHNLPPQMQGSSSWVRLCCIGEHLPHVCI